MERVVPVPALGNCASFTRHKSVDVIVHLRPLQSSGFRPCSPAAATLRLGPTQPPGMDSLKAKSRQREEHQNKANSEQDREGRLERAGREQRTHVRTELGQTMVGRMVSGQDANSTNLDNVKIRSHSFWEGKEIGSG